MSDDKRIENTMAQMRKGMLEFCTLLAIGHGPKYTADILSALKQANLLVVEGTLYPLLSRLKRDGFVVYEWKESPTGPPRKYYLLTDSGKEMIGLLKSSWSTISISINSLIAAYEKSY